MLKSTKRNKINGTIQKLKDENIALKKEIEKLNSKLSNKKENNSEYSFKTFFENATIGVRITNMEGLVIDQNQQLSDLTGYSYEECVGKNIWDLIMSEFTHSTTQGSDTNQIKDTVSAALAIEDISNYNTKKIAQIKCKNGSKKLVIVSHYIDDSVDEPVYITLVKDITEQKELEKDVLKLKKAVESSEASVLVTDYDGNIEYANSYFGTISGYSPDEYLGKNPNILKTDIHSSEHYKEMWDTIKSGNTWLGEFCNKKKDGTFYWEKAAVSPIYIDNEITHFVAIKTDISKQKKVEADLHSALQLAEDNGNYYRKLVENQTSGIAILEPIDNGEDFIFKFVNNTAKEILGRTNQIPTNRPFTKAFPNIKQTSFINAVQKVYNDGAPTSHEPFRYKDECADVWLKNHIYKNSDKELVVIISDITELKNKELELIDKSKKLTVAKEKAEESDKLKSSFLNTISHEFRTPMNAIIGFISIIEQSGKDISEPEKYFEIIKSNCHQLLKLIDDSLELSQTYSHTSQLYIDNISTVEVIDDVLKRYTPKADIKNLELATNFSNEAKARLIKSDKYKLEKIFTHVIENAVKFTDKGKIEISAAIKDDNLVIEVSDTGRGISKEKMGSVLQPYSQSYIGINREFEGSGIGLSLVKALLDMLDGRIEIDSELGIGTTVKITLPYNSDNKNKITLKPNIKQIDDLNVLIADDSDIDFFFLENILQNSSNNISRAANIQESIEIIKENNIDIILMDSQLVSKNNVNTLKEMKVLKPDVKTILQTEYDQTQFEDNQELGYDAMVNKPIQRENLLEIIKKLTDKSDNSNNSNITT